MTTRIVLGVDVGTSDTKVLATTLDGREIASASGTTTWTVRSRGWTETDPDTLVQRVFGLLAEATGRARTVTGTAVVVTGIAVTGMAEAGVLIDAHGRAAHPVIAWHDPRGEAELRAFPADVIAAFPGRTGLPVSSLATVAKLAWMRGQGVVVAGRRWLNVPDLVAFRLCGVLATELSLAARTGLLDQDTSDLWPEMIELLGATPDLVPPRVTAGTPWGRAGGDVPAEARGAVVTVAGHDHPVAAVGCGVIDTGTVFDSFGTAEAFVRSTAAPLDPVTRARLATSGFTVTHHVLAGQRILLAGTKAGLMLRRTLALLGAEHDPRRAALDAESCARSADERPADVVTVSGAANDDGVLAITTAVDISPADLWLAVVDHTIAEAAILLAVMDAEVEPATSAVVAGGWARMASIRAAKTASLPDIRFAIRAQAGAFGAALFAAHAVTADVTGPPGAGFVTAFTTTDDHTVEHPTDHLEVSV